MGEVYPREREEHVPSSYSRTELGLFMEQQEQLALEQSKQKIVMKEMSTAARGSIMRVSQVIVRCVDFTPSVTSEYWQAEGRGLPAVRT